MRIKHLIKDHILQCKIRNLIKDQYGLLHSTELLLSIILLLFIIATIANLSDNLNEKILSEEEFNTLETIAIESSDYLLNNPGNPENDALAAHRHRPESEVPQPAFSEIPILSLLPHLLRRKH